MFIASGSQSVEFAQALGQRLSSMLDPEVWTDGTFFAGQMTIEALHTVVRKHEFAACVFGGPGSSNENVLIELGMFLSVNGAGRTFIILWGDAHAVPSDLSGVTYVRIPGQVSNAHEAAEYAHRAISTAVARSWKEGGIRAKGHGWHHSFNRVGPHAIETTSCTDANRISYDLPEAIVIQSGSFVTFRATFVMHNYAAPLKGQFFGRGSKHRDAAHLHYVGTDEDLNIEFHGTMLAFLPDVAPIWGIFLSRDEVLTDGLHVSLGAFHLERVKGVST